MTSSAIASRISSASRSATCWLPSQREKRACRASAISAARRAEAADDGVARASGPRSAGSGEKAVIGGRLGSSVVDDAPGDPLLVDAAGEVEALEQELDRGGDDGGLLGAVGDVEGARGGRRPGACRAPRASSATYSFDGVRSPVSTMNPSSKASTTGSSDSSSTWRVNVAYSAFVMSRSTMRSSGASSPTDSSSILPTVEATTAPRSETRGAPSGSPSRTARLSAAASRTSRFATDTRTLTPERWLISGERRARWVSSATSSSMNGGVTTPGTPSSAANRRFSWRTIAISSVEGPRVVGPDLRPEAVLERRDDPAARGVVLRVGRGDHEQVERQADDEAADLDVALLEDVEQADLDPLGQVGQLVDGDDARGWPAG